jgi:hypothetical protein
MGFFVVNKRTVDTINNNVFVLKRYLNVFSKYSTGNLLSVNNAQNIMYAVYVLITFEFDIVPAQVMTPISAEE